MASLDSSPTFKGMFELTTSASLCVLRDHFPQALAASPLRVAGLCALHQCLIETHEADNLSLVSIIVLVSLKIFFFFSTHITKKNNGFWELLSNNNARDCYVSSLIFVLRQIHGRKIYWGFKCRKSLSYRNLKRLEKHHYVLVLLLVS